MIKQEKQRCLPLRHIKAWVYSSDAANTAAADKQRSSLTCCEPGQLVEYRAKYITGDSRATWFAVWFVQMLVEGPLVP